MFVVYCLIVVVILAVGIWLFARQRQVAGQPESPPLQRTLFDLHIGDIVQHKGTDWAVEGKLIYDQDGFIWQEYLLQDGLRRVWLSVEEDDWLEVALMEPTKLLNISSTEPPQELEFQGDAYRCVESGTARMTRMGEVSRPQAEQCRFFDYEGPDEKLLSVEDWSGELEVTVGKKILPRDINILPGDGASVHGAV